MSVLYLLFFILGLPIALIVGIIKGIINVFITIGDAFKCLFLLAFGGLPR